MDVILATLLIRPGRSRTVASIVVFLFFMLGVVMRVKSGKDWGMDFGLAVWAGTNAGMQCL